MKAVPEGYDFKYGRGGDDEEHRRHEADYRLLLERHTAVQRRTERLPDGIRTWTITEDPQLLAALQRHAQDMKNRFGHDRAIRSWDPLFQKLFEYRSRVQVTLRPLADGIYAELRSQDPEVVPYLYAHGDTLAAWVQGGFTAARGPSPLPQD